MVGWQQRRVTVVLVVALAVSGCSRHDQPTLSATTSTSARSATVSRYLVRPADEWTLLEAIDTTGPQVGDPSMDWYAEYDHPPRDSPQNVRLSGHTQTLSGLSGELGVFALHSVRVAGWDAFAGTSRPADPGGPVVVIFPLAAEYAAMALSYELSEAELVAWAAALREASPAEWLEAGGQVGQG
jgi:hypothetical protein